MYTFILIVYGMYSTNRVVVGDFLVSCNIRKSLMVDESWIRITGNWAKKSIGRETR